MINDLFPFKSSLIEQSIAQNVRQEHHHLWVDFAIDQFMRQSQTVHNVVFDLVGFDCSGFVFFDNFHNVKSFDINKLAEVGEQDLGDHWHDFFEWEVPGFALRFTVFANYVRELGRNSVETLLGNVDGDWVVDVHSYWIF